MGAVYYGKASEWERLAHNHMKSLALLSSPGSPLSPLQGGSRKHGVVGAQGGDADRDGNEDINIEETNIEGERMKTSISSTFPSVSNLLDDSNSVHSVAKKQQ